MAQANQVERQLEASLRANEHPDAPSDLLLIDLSHLFRTHWHATENQEVGEAFSRTVAQVNRLARDYPLTAVCCDAPPYNRTALFAGYKAQRETPPPMLGEQIRRTEERLRKDGFLVWKVPGFEADDLIATACKFALREEPPLSVTIASNDKDMLQLVSDINRIRVVKPMDGAVIHEAEVAEKWKVPARMLGDSLALQGDSSDGIPGLPGIGPVKAAKLLEHFKSLDALLQGFRTIENEKLREVVRDNLDKIVLARKLVTLNNEAPIDWDAVFVKREQEKITEGPPDEFDAEFTEDEPRSDADLDEVFGAPKTPESPGLDSSSGQKREGFLDSRVVPSGGDSGQLSTEQPMAQAATKPDPRQPGPTVVKTQPEATALAVRPADWSSALEPCSTRDAWTMATKLHESRLFAHLPNPEAVFAIVLRGRSLGIDAVTSLSTFHMIEGKPTMSAALIVGLVQRSGKARYFELLESSDKAATWSTHREGNQSPTKMTFTVEDAVSAGLMTRNGAGQYSGVSKSGRPSNWDKYRSTMIRWRAAVELARAVYPDVISGLYTPDEASDGTAREVD